MTSINTYNESSLHNALKVLYAANSNGNTEIKENGFIYDIVDKDGNVIEIQTKNLSKLLPKIMKTLELGKTVKLVYPLVISKRIFLISEDGTIISKRKSPRKESIYSLFNELTGIYPILLHENFSLDVIEINLIEERIQTDEPVQSKNNKRRFKKNWRKTNKRLEEIIRTTTFSQKDDYLKLLPKELNTEFCAKDIQNLLKVKKELPSSAWKNAHIMMWVLTRMNLISFTQIKNKSHYYTINK